MEKLEHSLKELPKLKLDEAKNRLISQNPQLEKDITAYFYSLSILLKRLGKVDEVFAKIEASVKVEGEFGRLTLRPLGKYLQTFEHNICDANLSSWWKNTNNLFFCGLTYLAIMLAYAFYLRNKLKGEYLSPNDDENYQMTTYGEQKIAG